jgi:hypothetical protein
MLVDASMQLTLLLWKPHPDEIFMIILIPTLQGFTDGIWQTQINGETLSYMADISTHLLFLDIRKWV